MEHRPSKLYCSGQDPSRWQPGGLRVRPGIVHQSPVNRSFSHRSISHQSTSHRATFPGHPVISHPVTGQPADQPGTSQPGISYQSFAYDLQTQFVPVYLPVNVPVQNYAPSISSHVSHGSGRRLPNVHTPGYEHSERPGYEHAERPEFPNPATSSKQLLPLEPDFSQISDPSVMIDPPNSTDVSQTRPSRKEKSTRDHKSNKRRRHRSASSSTSTSRSDTLNSWRRKKKSKRSKHSHKKRRSMTPSSSSNSSNSQLDIGKYTRAHKSPQVVQTPTPIQPEEPTFIPVNTQPVNFDKFQPNPPQPNKESDSETEFEVWSFDRAINEVFRLLPPELCPNT